jgi:hypothetical protein
LIPAHLRVPERDDVQQLYRKHGWPDNLNTTKFDADWQRLDARCSAVYSAEEPTRKVKEQERTRKWIPQYLERLRKGVKAAPDIEANYVAEWEVKKF